MISRRARSWVRKSLILAGILIITLLGFLGYKSLRFLRNIGVAVSNQVLNKPKNTYTVAVLGYGGGFHQGAYLTDTIIIAHLNYQTKKAVLISVPRDLWVKLPTKSKEPFAAKINSVYQLPLYPETFPDVAVKQYTKSDQNGLIKKVLKNISGLTIDSYVAIDFQAFKAVIETLGGVDINIEKSFQDDEYPIEGKENDLCGKEEKDLEELEKIATESMVLAFPCRYETISFQAGDNHLDAEEALKFARSRHSPEDGGDFRRALRQQKLIDAVVNKLLSPLYFPKIPELMDQVDDKIKTDALYKDLTRVIKQAGIAKQYTQEKLVLSTDNLLTTGYSQDGQYILNPKKGMFQWQKIHQKIQKLSAKTN